MRVLVSDTSMLIDLERGRLLESAFRLSWEFAVPDLLAYQTRVPALSLPDTSAIVVDRLGCGGRL